MKRNFNNLFRKYIDRRIHVFPPMYRDANGHRQVVPEGMRVVREFTKPFPVIVRKNGKPVVKPHGQMSDAWWASNKRYHGKQM